MSSQLPRYRYGLLITRSVPWPGAACGLRHPAPGEPPRSKTGNDSCGHAVKMRVGEKIPEHRNASAKKTVVTYCMERESYALHRRVRRKEL
jgi:hypothetical protein